MPVASGKFGIGLNLLLDSGDKEDTTLAMKLRARITAGVTNVVVCMCENGCDDMPSGELRTEAEAVGFYEVYRLSVIDNGKHRTGWLIWTPSFSGFEYNGATAFLV